MNATTAPSQAQATLNKGPNPTGGGAQRTPIQPGAFNFVPITAQKKSRYLNLMIYGQPGAGKTTLAGSAADLPETAYSSGYGPDDAFSSDVLVVSSEGGDMVFEGNDRVKHAGRIDFMKADRIEQVQKVFEWLATHCRERDANNEVGLLKLQNIAYFGFEHKEQTAEQAEQMGIEYYGKEGLGRIRRYRTVILDSLTDIEAQNMNHIMGISDKGFDIGDDLNPAGYTEFRKNNNTIQQLSRAFRNLNINLIIICGQKWQKDEMQRMHYGPWLTGQLATQVQSFVDIVGYMVISTHPQDATKEVRKLYVQPVAAVKFDAKCRIASFKGNHFVDPLFTDILKECKFI